MQIKTRHIASASLVAAVCAVAAAPMFGTQASRNEQNQQRQQRNQQGQSSQQQNKQGGQTQEMPLPEGWTQEDMQKCIEAGTPGEMHQKLAEGAGVWEGQVSMWMAPDSEPVNSVVVTTVEPVMQGRYVRVTTEGEMPGMGPYRAEGLYGYDNVTEEFVSSWIDNFSTGIMHGVGRASEEDGTLTWVYTYNDPITEKSAQMREVEETKSPDSKTLTVYGTNPKTGEEYKMMFMELTRTQPGRTVTPAMPPRGERRPGGAETGGGRPGGNRGG